MAVERLCRRLEEDVPRMRRLRDVYNAISAVDAAMFLGFIAALITSVLMRPQIAAISINTLYASAQPDSFSRFPRITMSGRICRPN